MGQVTYYPTYTKISDYTKGDRENIEKSLSVWDRATFSYSFEGYHIDDEENLYIPAGYDKEIIRKNFSTYEFKDLRPNYFDIPLKNEGIEMKFKPRDEIQLKSIQFLMDSRYDVDGYQKFLALKTGQGKTFCAVNYVAASKRIPMIFVHTKNLADQWKERILQFTNLSEDNVYIISGVKSIDKLYNMSDEDRLNIKFYIALHGTIDSISKKDELAISRLFKKLKISVKIFDEAHLRWESILNIDFHTECRSIYLTATDGRSDPIENTVYKRIFKMVPKFSDNSRKIKEKPEKYHNVVIYRYKSNPDQDFVAKFMSKSAKRGFNNVMYTNYIAEDRFDQFYQPLKSFILKAVYPERSAFIRKAMILVKQVNLLDKVYDALKKDLKNRNVTIAKKHSKMTATEIAENDIDKADLIVTTDSSMGTGSDIKDLSMVISTIPTSSEVTTTQILGRLRDIPNTQVYFVDYVDVSFEKSRNQLKNRMNKVYKKHAKTIKEL